MYSFLLVVLSLLVICQAQQPLYRGVNIGGWLVLESWIKPSLYNNNGVAGGTGEWGFCEKLGKQKCQQVLTQHWDTWVTQSDLQTLKNSGINYLRVPVGYWIVDIQAGEPFVQGGLGYLQRLLGWANTLGLDVIVDLHGAPGSQNGHDNSGRDGPINWPQPANIQRTVDVLANLTKQVMTYPAVKGIEFLNEPWTTAIGGPIQFDTLKSFYQSAYTAVRGTGFNGDVWISDGWDNNQWNGFMSPPNYQNVYLDVHLYHCFGGPRDQNDPYQNIAYTCNNDAPMLNGLTGRDWSVIGEWSNCVSNPPGSNFNAWAMSFTESQWTAYGAAGPNAGKNPPKGGFFWNFKIEGGNAEWSYLAGISAGSVPSGNWNFNGCQ